VLYNAVRDKRMDEMKGYHSRSGFHGRSIKPPHLPKDGIVQLIVPSQYVPNVHLVNEEEYTTRCVGGGITHEASAISC